MHMAATPGDQYHYRRQRCSLTRACTALLANLRGRIAGQSAAKEGTIGVTKDPQQSLVLVCMQGSPKLLGSVEPWLDRIEQL